MRGDYGYLRGKGWKRGRGINPKLDFINVFIMKLCFSPELIFSFRYGYVRNSDNIVFAVSKTMIGAIIGGSLGMLLTFVVFVFYWGR